MKDTSPIEFVGSGNFIQENTTKRATIKGVYDLYNYKPVTCVVTTKRTGSRRVLNPARIQKSVEFSGSDQDGHDVLVSGLLQHSTTTFSEDNVSYSGEADLFITGNLRRFNGKKGDLYCSFYIQPTPLAISRGYFHLNADGTIIKEEDSRQFSYGFDTPLGDAILTDQYDYFEGQAGGNKAITSVRQCQVQISIKTIESSLQDIIPKMSDYLDEVLWLISFLSRRRINWYRGELLFVPKDGSKQKPRWATALKSRFNGYDRQSDDVHWFNLIVKEEGLSGDGLQKLIANYLNSPLKPFIKRAILMLILRW